jgi:type II secretory pathway pseudopilin PulG
MEMKACSAKGFTIVEILVAIFILGTSLVSITLAFTIGLDNIALIKERSVAIQAAQEGIELVRNTSFDSILNLETDFYATGMDSLNSAAGSVTVDNPKGTADMRRVTITVDWTSARGDAVSESLATYVTRGGINKQ